MDSRDSGVRIDSTGALHPLGRHASVELRAREGEWRLLNSPPEVVLLCRASGRTVRVAGEIRSPGALADIIGLVAQGNMRGELYALSEAGNRILTFEAGSVVAASTTVPEERLGEILFRFGVVETREDLNAIVQHSEANGRRLGEMAIELGLVSPEQIYTMMARQVEEVAFGALHLDEGTFFFLEGFDERLIGRRFNISAMALLMEGARRVDELKFFREKVPHAGLVPVPTMATKALPEALGIVFAQCDGVRTIDEIGRSTGMLEFEITKVFYELVGGGFVKLHAERPHGPEAIVVAVNPALVLIHEACAAAGKLAELKIGLERFATGGGVYDSLFMMAGPEADGTLRADRVAKNIAAFDGGDQDAWLIQLMSEYVGFALFQSESLVTREVERELARAIDEVLKPLRPAT